MKKSLLLLSLMVSLGINSQIVNIPDANFKAKLLSSSPSNTVAKDLYGNYFAIDANGDGEIDEFESNEASELNITNSNTTSLIGLKSFVHLGKLEASNNPIISFEFFSNMTPPLNDLKKVILKNCTALQNFEFSSQIEELDVENCFSLENIFVENGNLTYLNIKNCPNLVSIHAEDNNLNVIENFNNINLKTIYLSNNHLTSLNLNIPSLEQIDLDFNELSTLNLVAPLLKKLTLFSNNLTAFNIHNYPLLEELDIAGNKIINLEIADHNKIKYLFCWTDNMGSQPINLPIYLKTINANNSSNLDMIVVNSSVLEKIFIKNGKVDNLNIFDSPNLQFICCDANEVATIQNNFPNVTVTSDCNIGPVLGTVENSSNPATIKVHPNPTKGDVTINADSKIKSVEVYDAQGRIIQKQMGINSQEAKVSIHSSTSGMYIFKITTEKEVITKKVIKN
jgi:hypothetical protein